MVLEHGAEAVFVGAEPVTEWERESHFGSINKGIGEVSACDIFEKVFSFIILHQDVWGCCEGVFDDFGCEEWGADFEGDGHRGGIYFAEDVLREVVGEFVEAGLCE